MNKLTLTLELDNLQELKVYSNAEDMLSTIQHVLYQIRNREKHGEDTHASAENLILRIKSDLAEVIYGLE
jgi:hypothetical protein